MVSHYVETIFSRFDRDSSGKATCSGQCATLWPPFARP